jgi:formate/nitrite transporter FocA (FNT family)
MRSNGLGDLCFGGKTGRSLAFLLFHQEHGKNQKEHPMDPQLKSTVTSAAMWLAGAVAAWLVSKGIVTSPDLDSTTAAFGTIIMLIVGFVIERYKSYQHTPDAVITAASHAPGVVSVITTPAVANNAAHNDNDKVVTASDFITDNVVVSGNVSGTAQLKKGA